MDYRHYLLLTEFTLFFLFFSSLYLTISFLFHLDERYGYTILPLYTPGYLGV